MRRAPAVPGLSAGLCALPVLPAAGLCRPGVDPSGKPCWLLAALLPSFLPKPLPLAQVRTPEWRALPSPAQQRVLQLVSPPLAAAQQAPERPSPPGSVAARGHAAGRARRAAGRGPSGGAPSQPVRAGSAAGGAEARAGLAGPRPGGAACAWVVDMRPGAPLQAPDPGAPDPFLALAAGRAPPSAAWPRAASPPPPAGPPRPRPRQPLSHASQQARARRMAGVVAAAQAALGAGQEGEAPAAAGAAGQVRQPAAAPQRVVARPPAAVRPAGPQDALGQRAGGPVATGQAVRASSGSGRPRPDSAAGRQGPGRRPGASTGTQEPAVAGSIRGQGEASSSCRAGAQPRSAGPGKPAAATGRLPARTTAHARSLTAPSQISKQAGHTDMAPQQPQAAGPSAPLDTGSVAFASVG
jgi:hypothetical protein